MCPFHGHNLQEIFCAGAPTLKEEIQAADIYVAVQALAPERTQTLDRTVYPFSDFFCARAQPPKGAFFARTPGRARGIFRPS